MPRPPVLPVIDWSEVLASGKTFNDWLASGESPENQAAMRRLLDEQVLDPQTEAWLRALPRTVYVAAIAEDWCGDVVRHVPVLERLAAAAPKLKVCYLARAQYPHLFSRYLTNGGEAIPKFIFVTDRYIECGNWGPMPETCRRLIARGRACGDIPAARRKVSQIYEMDADRKMVIDELLALITIACATTV